MGVAFGALLILCLPVALGLMVAVAVDYDEWT